jgi:hypothetical protein
MTGCAQSALLSLLGAREPMLRADSIMRSTLDQPAPIPLSRPAIEQQWNDTDGEFRSERRHVEHDVDLDACRLSERILERGAPVCVFGEYSTVKHAIIADPSDWSKITRVMKGNGEAIVGQLRASFVRRAIGALAFAALAAGALAAFLQNQKSDRHSYS